MRRLSLALALIALGGCPFAFGKGASDEGVAKAAVEMFKGKLATIEKEIFAFDKARNAAGLAPSTEPNTAAAPGVVDAHKEFETIVQFDELK